MGLYAAIAVRSFRRYATYRAATVAGAFTNTVFGLIVAHTYLALWDERPALGGYDVAQAVTFVWLGQALLAAMSLLGGGFEEELGERIRTGDVAVDLYRPVNLQLWWLCADLGRAGYHLLGRGLVPVLVGGCLFDLRVPTGPARWFAFLVSVLLGIVVSFALRYLVALSGFWLLDGSGVRTVGVLTAVFFSGMLLPLTLFPGWLGELARALPWSALLQVPADVYLGRHAGGELVGAMAFQAGWAVVLLATGQALTAMATRRVVVQGG
ncbi:ABC transporter permease [Wenjunlia vitaminophila]|uniref:ABC transporter permease n=1 Tax=Wenjunlia vitaminophila TaxID=76728 RepID=A0A0T6LPJ4_WENVI|nr:ABC-2 family transporter protein [Wenjunlia vitaminophila]KRV47740.1 ABC transporter permease [Wenjunlia vitaminophila]